MNLQDSSNIYVATTYFDVKKLQLPSPSIVELFANCKGENFNITGRGLAISSAKEGQSDPIYNLAMF